MATVMVPLIYEIHLMIRCNSRFANSQAETLSVKGMESVVGNSVYKWIETMCLQIFCEIIILHPELDVSRWKI